MRNKLSIFSLVLVYIYAFLIVYNPGFFTNEYLNYALPFGYWLIGLLFLNTNPNKLVIKIFNNRYINSYIIFGLLAILFFVFRALFARVSFSDLTHLRIVQSLSVLFSLLSFYYLERYLDHHSFTAIDKTQLLLNVCLIQFVFVLIMVLSPQFRMAVLERFYLKPNVNYSFTIAKRVYGLMSNYTFAGSVFHGIMAFMALYLGSFANRKFFAYVPVILLIVFLNSRIGLIVFIVATVFYFLYNLIFKNTLNRTLRITLIVSLILLVAFSLLPVIWPNTFNFFVNGFLDLFNYAATGVASNERISDIDLLANQLKTDFNYQTLLLGNGYRIQNSGDIPAGLIFKGLYSDIGFLNDMYMGGIIYMSLLYYPFIEMLIKTSFKDVELKWIFLVVAFLSNFKGEVFRAPIIIGTIIYLTISFDLKRSNE